MNSQICDDEKKKEKGKFKGLVHRVFRSFSPRSLLQKNNIIRMEELNEKWKFAEFEWKDRKAEGITLEGGKMMG